MKTNRRGGFTLVEVMIVVAIIALLAAIAVPNFLQERKRSSAKTIVRQELSGTNLGTQDEYMVGHESSILVTYTGPDGKDHRARVVKMKIVELDGKSYPPEPEPKP
jgi:prepilin-type N-terminal cleavage/methylation domain-containing protein